jgi:hypothetical protein
VRAAFLLALAAVFASPARADFRVTRTMDGVRLRLAGIHTQPLDLFVVGGPGLRVFRHQRLDPQRDGSFAVDLALPDAGLYMAFAEFVPRDGWPEMAQQAFTIGSVLAPRAGEPADEAHESDGFGATVDASQAKSGRESTVAFDLSGEAGSAPPEAFIVSSDLTEAQHLTAADASRGTHVVFAPVFPRGGRYKVWLIVRLTGRTATIPFVIDVS